MKKVLSVCLTLAMLLGMLSALTFTTSADGAVNLPENTFIVNPSGTEADTTCTWQGTTYNVTYGTNYFTAFNGARDKMTTAGGTILLCPGSYGAIAPGKSMTIKGAKAGIDPNVKGANLTDDWTLNPERSDDPTKESVFTGEIFLTAGNGTVLSSPIELTFDGIVIKGGYFSSKDFSAGKQTLVVKNTYLSQLNTSYGLLRSASGGTNLAVNLCERSITLQNFRCAPIVQANVFPALTADTFLADGVYMGSAAPAQNYWGQFIAAISVSKTSGEANYVIQNSMFRQKRRVLNLSFRDGAYADLKTANANNTKTAITVTVNNNVFADGIAADKTIQPQPHSANVTFNITNNTFAMPSVMTGYYPIGDYAESSKAWTYNIDNNTFINIEKVVANIAYATKDVWVTRSLFLNPDGTVKTDFECAKWAKIKSYYLDTAKTTLHYADNTVLAFKGVQLSAPADNKVNIRFIVAVDDLDYAKAGLTVTAKEGEGAVKSASFDVKTVYTSITAATDAGIETYSAGDLGGKYLMAVTLTGVPADVASLTFTVKANAEITSAGKIDGTKYQIVMKNGAVAQEDITKVG